MSTVPLELGLSLDAIPRLRRHPLLAALTQGRPRRSRERAIYFDTPDFALARAGFALCIRRVARLAVQSVARLDARGPGPADTVVASEVPDLASIPDVALRAQIAGCVAGRPLVPAFEVDLTRELRVLREDANEIHFSLDSGSVKTAHGLVPVCSLALDTRAGDPAYVVQLALELLDALPLRTDAQHPAASARAMLLGESVRPRKAELVEVGPEATLEALLEACVEACLRLRSALSFFAPVLPARQRAALRALLRPLASALGPARDLDVFAEEWLAPALRARPDDAGLATLDARVRALRAERAEQVRRALESVHFPRLVLEIRHWLASHAWRDQVLSADSAALFAPARDFASRRLERRHRKTRRALRGLAEASSAERHALRIEAKQLRYAAEFTASLFPGRRARRYARRLAALQDALGVANDAVVAERIAAEIAGADAAAQHAAGFVTGWAAHAAHAEIARLGRLAERFAEAGRYWPRPAPTPAAPPG
ncbi:MAG: CHAD domain-containing protein [Myxococcota bacterium]|nr:CHAD domain-containing protein [Myxococcota bacterium]